MYVSVRFGHKNRNHSRYFEQEGICHRELSYTTPKRVLRMKVRKTDRNVKKSQEVTNSLVSCTKSQAPMTSDTCTIKVSSFQVFIYSPCHCLQLPWKADQLTKISVTEWNWNPWQRDLGNIVSSL